MANPLIIEAQFRPQNEAVLREIDNHELLKINDGSNVAAFAEIKALGEVIIAQEFNKHFMVADGIPQSILRRHFESGNDSFLTKIQVPRYKPNGHVDSGTVFYPATAQVVISAAGSYDMELLIVPVPLDVFEKGKFERHSDSMLALAAAAATAPQFILAFQEGIASHHHHDLTASVSQIEPGHSSPLAVMFGAFDHNYQPLQSVLSATGNHNNQQALTVKRGAHLHELDGKNTQLVTQAAAQTNIAAGVKVRTVRASHPQMHSTAIFLKTLPNQEGKPSIVSLDQVLRQEGLHTVDKAFAAAALGMTREVVGQSERETVVSKILTPNFADESLVELLP